MTLKKCGCGKVVTTKTAKVLGRETYGNVSFLFFNCSCGSTLTRSVKKLKKVG